MGLLFVDLNDFKDVNDRHSHEAGDELLRQVAQRLDSTARSGDGVARLGGDEFAIVLTDASQEQLEAAARRVREVFREPFRLQEVTIALGASVGGGVWPEHGRAVSELVQYADAAMYRDKARARAPHPRAGPPRLAPPVPYPS